MSDIIGQALQKIRDHVSDFLLDNDHEVGLSYVSSGQAAWDNCCDTGGQLAVRIIQMFPSGSPFPKEMPDGKRDCPSLTAIKIGVEIVRCVHTLDDQGRPPSEDEINEDARYLAKDSELILQSLTCEDVTHKSPIQKIAIDKWESKSSRGGCGGGEWQFYIATDWPGCCDED